MAYPTVSIILPSYNRPHFLRQAVASVMAQTHEDWELIIADDGSAEETRAYLEGLDDPRISVLWLAHSGVPSIARNAAITRARGKYITFLDSDDLWYPTKLARQLEALRQSPDCRWSYSAVDLIHPDGGPFDRTDLPVWLPHDGDITERILTIDAQIAIDAVMIERSLLDEVGSFDEQQRFSEEYDLYLRLSLRSHVKVVDAPLAIVRASDGANYSANRIGAYEGWVQLYVKYTTVLPSRRLRAVARRRLGESRLLLARVYSKAGQPRAAWRTLLHGVASLIAYPSWGWWASRAVIRIGVDAWRGRKRTRQRVGNTAPGRR